MILQALKDYYDRKAADAESGIAPLGWEWKEIPFLIVLREDGSFVHVENTCDGEGRNRRAKSFLVPQGVKRSGKNFSPNLLWDKTEYVLGVSETVTGDIETKHAKFIEAMAAYKDIAAVQTILTFLETGDKLSSLTKESCWNEIKKGSSLISFKIVGHEHPVFRTEMFVCRYNELLTPRKYINGRCSICGEVDSIPNTHPKIIGVSGTDKGRGDIVSFNWKAACSFGKEQNYNASIGYRSSFAYTTALNTLLGKDSAQKLQVGDATTVFWADKSCDFENELAGFFEEPKDNPDALTTHVEALLQSVESGAYAEDDEPTRFFVLGLAPNSARIAVRFWHAGTVAELAGRFAAYFRDLEIAHGPKEQKHLSLWRLLVSTAVQGKSKNIAPNLAGNFMRAILEGLPFPESLLQAVILRIKAEREVSYPRAKLIKGCLNRKLRFRTSNQERSLTVSLDKDNLNIGYRLGRLFATLEKIQEEANPGINATIRDRFYAAASSSPQTVFGNLMRLKNHHLAKLENAGRRVNFERQIGEIISGFQEFPAHLSLDDQGRFAIGYYHQRQDFFTKKPETTQD